MSNDDPKPPIKPPDFSQMASQTPQQEPGPFGILIPDKNASSLIAYYCGLFAIIPCVGLVIGPIAFVKGRQALAAEKAHPEIKGGTHAKVGIGCGTIGFLFNAAILALVIALIVTGGK